MKLQNRIELFTHLKNYFSTSPAEWQETTLKASLHNPWFIPEFIEIAVNNITAQFLDLDKMQRWVDFYHIDDNIQSKNVGIVMAGNIPLVGFHDFLCAFITGHKVHIKPAEKDTILLKHIINKLYEWAPETKELIFIEEMLKGCDAYIATGSNNTARYFDHYFGKYPSIIRKNRTSVAILSGQESDAELEKLTDDVHLYFGLGCRNVTKIFVPEQYDFVPLLNSFRKYSYFSDNGKYKNNYDYNLSILLLNKQYYMTNETTLLAENDSIFSPIGQLHYGYYKSKEEILKTLKENNDIQCIVGEEVGFGEAQCPGLFTYADGVDTMQFLLTI